jgi:predicted transcriptional regulator
MFRWHEFRPDEKGVEKVLSPLESEIMQIMWDEKISVARDIYEIMKKKEKKTRRSTISIMMNRLRERGLLERQPETGKGGERYVYTVRVSKEEFSHAVVDKVMRSLIETFEDATIRYVRNHLSDEI